MEEGWKFIILALAGTSPRHFLYCQNSVNLFKSVLPQARVEKCIVQAVLI